MLTIGRLAERFGLSRSTLLYYDSIGLLSPSERSHANYRLYSEADVERMERISVYRQAGVPLADITRLLSGDESALGELLAARLKTLNEDIRGLRRQQRLIVTLLKNDAALRDARAMDKDGWVAILRAAGLTEEDMRRWHIEFERLSPEAHQDFLESLGIGEAEVSGIRRWSAQARGRVSPKGASRQANDLTPSRRATKRS
ncbi:MAG: MerR family transcriptional regulator [Vicinamibacteria bacterium]